MKTFENILAEWQEAKALAHKFTTMERELRLALFGGAVPNPKEGVNNVELADGRVCKFTYKLNRTLKDPEFCMAELREAGVNDVANYVAIKYDLSTKGYKSAPPEVRDILDQFVETKPGLPTLEVK